MHGLLLAAGQGRRMGIAKGLLRAGDGTPFVARAVELLLGGGCDRVTVVVGAESAAVAELVPAPARVLVAEDWAEGMGASLRAGLLAVPTSAESVVLTLVDLPDLSAAVVSRLLAAGHGADGLARAAYDGVPGHPVLLGRSHWPGVVAAAVGDRGARDYLRARTVQLVECADLATGRDVDTPAEL